MHHTLVQTPNPAETNEDSLLPHLNLIDAQLSVYSDPYYSTNCTATCKFPMQMQLRTLNVHQYVCIVRYQIYANNLYQ